MGDLGNWGVMTVLVFNRFELTAVSNANWNNFLISILEQDAENTDQ